jgi:hypothetical protein
VTDRVPYVSLTDLDRTTPFTFGCSYSGISQFGVISRKVSSLRLRTVLLHNPKGNVPWFQLSPFSINKQFGSSASSSPWRIRFLFSGSPNTRSAFRWISGSQPMQPPVFISQFHLMTTKHHELSFARIIAIVAFRIFWHLPIGIFGNFFSR